MGRPARASEPIERATSRAEGIVWALAAAMASAILATLARLFIGPHYPLSDDGPGHLYKAITLFDALRTGQGIPTIFTGWYAGAESFRYWPITTYLLLLPGLWLGGTDSGLAVQLLIVGGLAAAGTGVLLWRRALGWPLTILGALLAAVLPGPVHVAFMDGNLPRVVAQALLLPTVWAAVEGARGAAARRPALLLVALVALTVLVHPMLAAVASSAATLVLLTGALAGHWRIRAIGHSLLLIVAGFALTGWSLVPALGGGAVGLNPDAVIRGLDRFAPWEALNPARPRALHYFGLALLVATLVALYRRGRASAGWPYLAAGLPLVVAAVDPFASLYLHLPLAYLLWPVRLVAAGQALLLLGLLHVVAEALTGRGRQVRVGLCLLALVAGDALPSLAIIRGGVVPSEQQAIATRLAGGAGWREATLDLSRLGSSPTFLWRDREQLFGWAYQSATIAPGLADLNEALEQGRPAYLVDRLDWWGIDDVVLDRPNPDLEAVLAAHGFAPRRNAGSLRHWSRTGGPRAILLDHAALGIGQGARIWAARFPRIVHGDSDLVDDYTLDQLRRFDRLVLSRPQWRDRAAAEALIRAYAAAGGQVIIDLTGAPDDPFARAPRFLGVYGERLPFAGAGQTLDDPGDGPGQSRRLLPFALQPWSALTYAGLDRVTVAAPYAGESAAVAGQIAAGAGQITFIGLNLPYHLLLTGDAVAADLLVDQTGLALDRGVVGGTVPLEGYRSDGAGYRFSLTLDRDERVVIPVARHDRLTVTVDGRPGHIDVLDNTVTLELPAGRHAIVIAVAPGGNRPLGLVVTALGLVLIGWLLRRRPAVRATDGPVALPGGESDEGGDEAAVA